MMNEWYRPNNGSNNNNKFNFNNLNNEKKTRFIALIILCTVMIIAAVLPAASNIVTVTVKNNGNADSNHSYSTDELPEDFHDFFANFYTDVNDGMDEISIPKYKDNSGFKVELVKSEKEDMSLQDLYDVCKNQIVSISSSLDGKDFSIWGSGIVMSEDGLILTNTHVVEGSKKVLVRLTDGNEYEASLVGADDVSDISILKINPDVKLKPAAFADISDLKVGDKVAAIGSPIGSSFINTLTDGIVSGIERDVSMNGRNMSLIQTNAALNEGNSGGALFNMQGQVIGVTNMKLNSRGVSIEGIGFAIPSNTVKTISDSLLTKGFVKRTTIGVVVGSIPQNVSNAYELPKGLYVSEVTKDSGADEAGIKAGDVITKVNGKEISTTNEVNEIKDELSAGDILKMTVYREGQYLDFDVVLK